MPSWTDTQKPLRVDDAPPDRIQQLFLNRAHPLTPSRERILKCRDMRRNLIGVPVDKDWIGEDTALKSWVQTFLPVRQSTVLNLTNTLGDEIPVVSKHPIGQTDRAQDDADEAETFISGLVQQCVDWDEIMGTIVEDSELAIAVMPSPAGLTMAPDFMMTVEGDGTKSLRKRNPKYDRTDEKGEYSGKRSIAAWRKEYQEHLSTCLPINVMLVKATDCAPIFGIGTGKQRLECRGLIVRQLYSREDLLTEGYRGKLLEPNALIPAGFNPDRTTGQQNMLYLYTAFVNEVDEKTGEKTPFIARCVGGEYTEMYNGDTGENESTIINLKDEYGLTDLPIGYFWGLHYADDDPAWRGCPVMYPVINTILGKEGLLQASKAHAHENAFTGHITSPNPSLPEKLLLEAAGTEKRPKKPKANEIVQTTGVTVPWAQSQIGDDVKWLLAEHDQELVMSTPDPQQFGEDTSDSGHAMVVGHELLTSAKRQIKEGARLAVEFIIEQTIRQLCGLARGRWKMTSGKGVNACLAVDVARTIERTGAQTTVSEIIEFNERWFGTNYSITAKYPAVGNLAERRQTFDDWQAGAGTFREMRESRGDQSPETTRFEIARDKWFEGPLGQAVLAVEVAKARKQMELAAKLQQQVDGQLTQIGLPTDALAPEFSGGGAAGSPGQLPDMAGNSLNGAIQGEMGTAARQADATAAMTVNPTGSAGMAV